MLYKYVTNIQTQKLKLQIYNSSITNRIIIITNI